MLLFLSCSQTCSEAARRAVLLIARARCGRAIPDLGHETFLAGVVCVAPSTRALAVEGAADVGVLTRALNASASVLGSRTRNYMHHGQTRWNIDGRGITCCLLFVVVEEEGQE